MVKDYYQTLGVPKNASEADIKKAYRKLAMQYHPDRNPGKEEWANQKFKEINEAYGVLGDEKKRKQYDQFGTVGDPGDVFGSANTRSTFEDLMKEFQGAGLDFGFLDSIFGEVLRGKGSTFSFRRYGRPGRSRYEAGPEVHFNFDEMMGRTKSPPRGDVRYELTLKPEEAISGTVKTLKRKGKRLEVKIPAGTKEGSVIRLRNARQVTDGQPGDILVKVALKGSR